jgi:ATP-dependent Clp protease ATP-binding subunit ClpC
MAQARQEARELRHDFCGTEHILLGLLREQDGFAARILNSFGVKLEEVRARVVELVGQGELAEPGPVTITPRAERVLGLAREEALSLGVEAIGTEHIPLGLAHENGGVAMRILTQYYADSATIRNEVIRRFASPDPPRTTPGSSGRDHRGGPTSNERGADLTHEVRIEPSADVRRLMQSAAARALDDGRSQIELGDLLLARTRLKVSAAVLAELGVDEAAVCRAIGRDEPPWDQTND